MPAFTAQVPATRRLGENLTPTAEKRGEFPRPHGYGLVIDLGQLVGTASV